MLILKSFLMIDLIKPFLTKTVNFNYCRSKLDNIIIFHNFSSFKIKYSNLIKIVLLNI